MRFSEYQVTNFFLKKWFDLTREEGIHGKKEERSFRLSALPRNRHGHDESESRSWSLRVVVRVFLDKIIRWRPRSGIGIGMKGMRRLERSSVYYLFEKQIIILGGSPAAVQRRYIHPRLYMYTHFKFALFLSLTAPRSAQIPSRWSKPRPLHNKGPPLLILLVKKLEWQAYPLFGWCLGFCQCTWMNWGRGWSVMDQHTWWISQDVAIALRNFLYKPTPPVQYACWLSPLRRTSSWLQSPKTFATKWHPSQLFHLNSIPTSFSLDV